MLFAFKSDNLKNFWHNLVDVSLGLANNFKRECDVFSNRLIWQQPKVLENRADLAAKVWDLPIRQSAEFFAGYPD
ncbi:unannotated protein [freshwater metagenome]|uniref:Unannotated protein n=1 Tax=freshwater metagenome TaxID=449393 RepID=A0A6J7SLJ9_9ZZZZ